MSSVSPELLEILVCPETKQPVAPASGDVLARVNAEIDAGRLRNRGVTLTTVHGNQAIMEAAAAAKGDVKILAVTVLTSLDRGDLDDLGFACDVGELVLSRARRALEAGCDGVVSSGLEAPMKQLLSGFVLAVFATVAVARALGVDAESALRRTTRSFTERYERFTELARERGLDEYIDRRGRTYRFDGLLDRFSMPSER